MADSALSEVQAATLTANTTASTASTNISSQFSSVGQVKSITAGLSLAGMNTDKVDLMKQAVKTYIENVDKVLNDLQGLEANEAFGTQIGGVVQEYVKSVKTACKALIDNLYAFCDDLSAIKQAYEAKAESMKSAIGKTSGDMYHAAFTYKYSSGLN